MFKEIEVELNRNFPAINFLYKFLFSILSKKQLKANFFSLHDP